MTNYWKLHILQNNQPSVNATKYQKGVNCVGVKVFNTLPFYIKTDVGNPINLKQCYKNSYGKIRFSPWMNILKSTAKI